jgi:hypothetical protein
MSPTQLRSKPLPHLRRSGRVFGLVAAVALAAALVAAVASSVQAPADVPALTVDNPTVYQLNVEVSPDGTGGWLDLGAVGRERAKTIEQIADQGQRWVFRFSYGGVDAGRVVLSRPELVTARWTVIVPAEAGERLRAAGLQPSAF